MVNEVCALTFVDVTVRAVPYCALAKGWAKRTLATSAEDASAAVHVPLATSYTHRVALSV